MLENWKWYNGFTWPGEVGRLEGKMQERSVRGKEGVEEGIKKR
jgi:hypothetical protein